MIYKIIMIFAVLIPIEKVQASNEIDINTTHSNSSHSQFRGSVGFTSSSFLFESKIRGNSSTTFQSVLEDGWDSHYFRAEGDIRFYTFVQDRPSIGFESKELYLQTNPELLGASQITVGRKLFEWSKLDRNWTMMSLWSPRFTWDELHPELIGMTGLFYSLSTSNFELIAFGSPIAIPERGTLTEEKNNQIVSSNPFWKPLPTSTSVLGKPTALHYSLITPPMKEILIRPNFALHGKYSFDSGFWISANGGVLPVNMVQVSAEPFLTASVDGDALVNIHPQFPMRNIYTAEAGFQNHVFGLWTSLSYERPFHFTTDPFWVNPTVTPSSILSAGTDVKLSRKFSMNGAALMIQEQATQVNSNVLSQINVPLPTRFPLKQGLKVGGNWKFSDMTESNLTWIRDLINQNHFVSLDVEHSMRKSKVSVGAGADVILAESSKGWVGQYYGDDRLRGWLKYAF